MSAAVIRVGVAALVENEGRLLLGRRAKPPYEGRWVIPGGGVMYGETHRVALVREMREETGLVVYVGQVATVRDIIDTSHRVVIYYRADAMGGRLEAGDDLSEVCWAGLELRRGLRDNNLLTPTVREVLHDLGYFRDGSG